ncbi:MAG: FAD-binding protein [Gammaproteobacteria bacterium]|nr:FAD-binding protein [Gammaproteobacteria bacterium]
MQRAEPELQHYDVIVVGAGMAGLYLLYKLRAAGFSVIALETADPLFSCAHHIQFVSSCGSVAAYRQIVLPSCHAYNATHET